MFIVSNVASSPNSLTPFIATSVFNTIDEFVQDCLYCFHPIIADIKISGYNATYKGALLDTKSSVFYVSQDDTLDLSNSFINAYNSFCFEVEPIRTWAAKQSAAVLDAVSAAILTQLYQLVYDSLNAARA